MGRIIVTGGAGFIGSNVVMSLAERGEDVVVVDRLGDGDKWLNLRDAGCLEIVPPERLDDLLADRSKFVGLVHMGAISSTTERDVDLIVATNVGLSSKLWSWCAASGVPFVYASSAATYGDGTNGFVDRDDEAYLSRLQPLNPYGWSKHLFDRWALRAAGRGEAPPWWAGLKFFNVYGPHEAHKGPQRSVAAQLHDQILATGEARLFRSEHADYPDGGQLRDFVWVGDAVAAVLWFLEARRPSGLYNVGSGSARTFADLAAAVFQALALPPRIVYVPMPPALGSRYQYVTRADTTKLAAAGFSTPATSLEEGVSRYVREHLTGRRLP